MVFCPPPPPSCREAEILLVTEVWIATQINEKAGLDNRLCVMDINTEVEALEDQPLFLL